MDLTSLYNLATTIRYETADDQNTAERVGSLFYSIVGALEEIFTTTANDVHAGLMSVATYNTTMMSVKRLDGAENELNKHGGYILTLQTIQGNIQNDVNRLSGNITEINGKIPSAQTAVVGTDRNYVYSLGNHEDTKTLISSNFWIYQHTDGNMFFRVKHWGAANDKKETDCSQVMIPNAWTGANGLLRRDVYSRLDSFALREENSTTTKVVIVTPIFTTGGTRTFSISRATSAKAGVMSAEDKTKLDTLAASRASATTDGLMSKETYNTLATQVVRIGDIDEKVNKLIARIEALEKK